MKIKSKEAFMMAQRVARHAATVKSESAWATAQKHLAAAYGHETRQWYEKYRYVI